MSDDQNGAAADPVQVQYEAYPYPARDPKDEETRLIAGSPSEPVEIDHFLFGGKRDWRAPFRVLVAGGGAGDALVMLAQRLADRGTPAEIHYLDLSKAARAVAEARIAARGLTRLVTFHTADLLAAPELGPFDYIDCCGVLHHLPDPEAGFRALAAALSPGGGLGAMVYAPYGRAGLYELQAALKPLIAGRAPDEQVRVARAALAALPPSNGFKRNPFLGEHLDSDAGLYDLLLHARDRPFTARAVLEALDQAGLALAGWLEPARYAPETYLGAAARDLPTLGLDAAAEMAERLAGDMKTHIFYAAPRDRGATAAPIDAPDQIPVLHRIEPRALAASIAKTGRISFELGGARRALALPDAARGLIARAFGAYDGVRTFGAVQQALGVDWLRFVAALGPAHRLLAGYNLLRCSRFRA